MAIKLNFRPVYLLPLIVSSCAYLLFLFFAPILADFGNNVEDNQEFPETQNTDNSRNVSIDFHVLKVIQNDLISLKEGQEKRGNFSIGLWKTVTPLVTEVEELRKLLIEEKDKISELSKVLGNLRVNVGENARNIDTLSAHGSEIGKNIDRLSTQVSEIGKKVDKLQNAVAENTKKFDRMQIAVDENTKNIEKLTKTQQAQQPDSHTKEDRPDENIPRVHHYPKSIFCQFTPFAPGCESNHRHH